MNFNISESVYLYKIMQMCVNLCKCVQILSVHFSHLENMHRLVVLSILSTNNTFN